MSHTLSLAATGLLALVLAWTAIIAEHQQKHTDLVQQESGR